MTDESAKLYIWLDGEPGVSPPTVSIDDIPGISDRDLVAQAIEAGTIGRFLPVRIRIATHPNPSASQIQSIDTARLLQAHAIRHRRRYEIMSFNNQ